MPSIKIIYQKEIINIEYDGENCGADSSFFRFFSFDG